MQQGEISASTMGAADGEEAPVWFMERVCVTLRNGGTSGVVKEINDNIARVECEDGAMSQLSPSDVIMVAPKEHDMVSTGGADVGVEGDLVCIDGTDAILKDSNEDFKIVLTLCISPRLLVMLRICDLYFQSFGGATIFTLLVMLVKSC